MKTFVAPLCALFLVGPAVAADSQPPARTVHSQAREMPARAPAQTRTRTAEEMRAGSVWGQYGGMSGGDYQGVGGPDESEEGARAYPSCRSRSDDRCRQRR